MSKVLQEKEFGSLPSSTKTNLRDHVKSISTDVETNTTPIRHIGSTRYAVSDPQNSKLFSVPSQMTIPFLSHLNDYCCDEKKGSYRLQYFNAYSNRATLFDDSLPLKEKDPGSFTLPCYINHICFEKALVDLGASVSVMPLSNYLNLGLVKLDHTKLTVELAGRTVKHPKGIVENVLVGIGKFVFPVDFIILDMSEDINVPLILERPFLSTAHAKVVVMDLDLEARLMGETLILNRSFDPLNRDCIELNDLNEPLELRRNQVDDLEPTIKEFMENMDIYHDKEMGDVIVGEPFCKVLSVEARRFDGLITIHNGDDNVTYQMMRSHPRFKYLSNE
ncbi:ribonuclease H-like domain-containing protein [Tanacetum coccineum]